jgi:hypothetical protein
MLEAGQSLDAGTDIGRLNVIISEFMVSLYGNGIDAYMLLQKNRRTNNYAAKSRANQEVLLDLSYILHQKQILI